MNIRSATSTEMALAGVRVLVTRAGEDAAPLRCRLEAAGADVLELPAVAIEPPADTEPLDRALRELGSYDWIAFASRNAVRAVFDRLAALGIENPSWPRVAAVGPATAEALEARGVGVTCRPEIATAGDLAGAMECRDVAGKRVLIPAGDISRPELVDGLRAAGATLDEVIAYRTVQPDLAQSTERSLASLHALRRGGVDVVALASPSAIRNLVSMLGAGASVLQYVKLVCIGPTTAAATRELGFEPAAVADQHTLDGLVTAIGALCAHGEGS